MPPFRYFLFHKPYRVLTQFSREGDKQTLADWLPQLPKTVYPVGRLDWDSEGLLLLTDDKKLTHQLLDPAHGHPRTYWVQVEGAITDEALQRLRQGISISIDGKPHPTLPAQATRFDAPPPVADRHPPVRYRAAIPTSWISLTLTEGKNRQVRRMTAAVGFPTLRLTRHAIGTVTLDGLRPGDYREAGPGIRQQLLGARPAAGR